MDFLQNRNPTLSFVHGERAQYPLKARTAEALMYFNECGPGTWTCMVMNLTLANFLQLSEQRHYSWVNQPLFSYFVQSVAFFFPCLNLNAVCELQYSIPS